MSSGFQSSTIARFSVGEVRRFYARTGMRLCGFCCFEERKKREHVFLWNSVKEGLPLRLCFVYYYQRTSLRPVNHTRSRKLKKKVSQLRPWERSWRCQHSDRSFSEHRWSGGPFFTGLTPVFKSSEWLTLRLRQNQFHLITNSWLRVSKSWNTENKNNV